MLNKKIIHIFIATFLISIIILSGCSSAENEKENAGTGYNNNFTLENLEGEKISLSKFEGKIVVLNFWATWCPPCKAEIPDFVDVYNQYKEEGVEFVGVSMDSGPDLREFIKAYNINYTILVDGTVDQVSRKWEVRAVPTTYILGKNGEILFKNVGLMQKAQLISEIEKRL